MRRPYSCSAQLDPALIRSGRIDYVLHFDLATRDQAKRLFVRFFESETATDAHDNADSRSRSTEDDDVTDVVFGDEEDTPRRKEYLKRLELLATAFAAGVEPGTRSMADLQVRRLHHYISCHSAC